MWRLKARGAFLACAGVLATGCGPARNYEEPGAPVFFATPPPRTGQSATLRPSSPLGR